MLLFGVDHLFGYAAIDRDVVITGNNDLAQIWAKDQWLEKKKAELKPANIAALLGRPLADDRFNGIVDAGTAISQLLYCKSFFMRSVLKIVKKKVDKAEKEGKAGTDLMFAYHMPLRSMANMTAGKITHRMVEDVVFLSNGHFFRGLGRFIRDYFRGQKRQKNFQKELDSIQ